MSADWQRIKEIVADAMELDSTRRTAFVEQACAGDEELRRDVDTLLRAGDSDSPVLDLDRVPARIGPYRIVREIGRGGMGTVYLGERDDGQFEQRVAIKVIKRGMDSDAVLRRFFEERRILARLQHPNITRLFDGGMYDGRPYFVMEYLEGEPIAAYAKNQRLSLDARIRLFLVVCDAVEYAHRNLILHRDLKPGNILVDSTGAPKLLDFGIAKVLEEDDSEQTALGMRPLTPHAASPEQVRGEPLTTAADVYALGLLLFELLAGTRAYSLTGASFDEIRRVVCEQPAPRPSDLAGVGAGDALRGDLDNIVLKALEKDPALRYQRAADLAADLNRYLSGLPVQARAGGALYRMRKFAVRNRRPLAVAALAGIAIGIAAGDAVLQGRRAQRRFNELRQLAGTFLFEFHDAIANLPGATPARELVEQRAVQYLDSLSREASNDPSLKLELAESYIRIGDVQGLGFESNLGRPAEARASYQKADALLGAVRKSNPNDEKALSALAALRNRQASLGSAAHDRAGAYKLLLESASILDGLAKRRPLDANDKFTLGLTSFGMAEYQAAINRTEDALRSRQRSIDVFRELAEDPGNRVNRGDALRWYATSEKRLAFLYLQQLHQPGKAVEPLNVAMGIDQRRVAQNPSDATAKIDLALGQSYLAALLRRQGDLPRARQLLEEAIRTRKDVLAVDPSNYRVRFLLASDCLHLGDLLREQKRAADARLVYREGSDLAAALQPRATSDPDAVRLIADLASRK